MVIDNRLLPSAARSSSDAYETYWSSTEEGTSEYPNDRLFPSSNSLSTCRPGEAYSELWQLWDAQ
ncbi:MAG TPA: hypothetical protein VKU02_01840 [Gemmataceae bacterium]|nr:hypothetical protein [Gemmataceae bacterium]